MAAQPVDRTVPDLLVHLVEHRIQAVAGMRLAAVVVPEAVPAVHRPELDHQLAAVRRRQS